MSGGGGHWSNIVPERLSQRVRDAEERTTISSFETDLSGVLGSLLVKYNDRDADSVRARLDGLKKALEGQIDGSLDQLFGGSVAKHTYVDGLSDIDSLLILNGTKLEANAPNKVLRKMEASLKQKLRGNSLASVSSGRMAVTIEYNDGMTIQLLPAIKTEDGRIKVPSSRRDDWSRIEPETFQKALTRRNDECAGKLVPTIKLAKAIMGQLPEEQRLSGYHVESLAISAFRQYEGEKTTTVMLPAFFEKASHLVLSPIKDSTGQSVHVDEYLGSENSAERQARAHLLSRIARRMRNASAANSVPQWRALFGLDDE